MSQGKLNKALNIAFFILMIAGGYFFISRSDPAQLRHSLAKVGWELFLSLLLLNLASIFLVWCRFAVLV